MTPERIASTVDLPMSVRGGRRSTCGSRAQLEQVAQRGADLVGRRAGDRREAPLLDERVAGERAEMRLRVADVDGEEHAGDSMLPRYTRRGPTPRAGCRRPEARAPA